jgi:hypothetical protein
VALSRVTPTGWLQESGTLSRVTPTGWTYSTFFVEEADTATYVLIPGVGVVPQSNLLVPGSGIVQPLSVTIPRITTTALDPLQVGVAFSQQLVATGDEPITWSGTVPDGLTLSSTGLLSGTPTTAGAYSFTVTATNAGGSDDQLYTGTIAAEEVPVTSTVPGPGGSGYPVYWQGKRRKRRLEEQPNLHLKKVLDDVVAELYGELTEDDVPKAVQAKAAKLVKPFVEQKSKKLAIPPESAVDWTALERDASRVRQIIALWRKQEFDAEIEAEDEYLLLVE